VDGGVILLKSLKFTMHFVALHIAPQFS